MYHWKVGSSFCWSWRKLSFCFNFSCPEHSGLVQLPRLRSSIPCHGHQLSVQPSRHAYAIVFALHAISQCRTKMDWLFFRYGQPWDPTHGWDPDDGSQPWDPTHGWDPDDGWIFFLQVSAVCFEQSSDIFQRWMCTRHRGWTQWINDFRWRALGEISFVLTVWLWPIHDQQWWLCIDGSLVSTTGTWGGCQWWFARSPVSTTGIWGSCQFGVSFVSITGAWRRYHERWGRPSAFGRSWSVSTMQRCESSASGASSSWRGCSII